MKKLLLTLSFLASCGGAVNSNDGVYSDLSQFDDGLSLKLCDSAGNCQNPGQMILFSGGDFEEHHPFHWAAAEPTDVSNWAVTQTLRSAHPDLGRFEIKCDHLQKNVFACAATMEE